MPRTDPTDLYDAIVIGGGPAGLSAATWLARYRKRVLVLDSHEPRNRWVEQTHGYLGADPLVPSEFLDQACAQLLRYPEAELGHGRVAAATRHGDRFVVDTGSERHEARRLVLATGMKDTFPDVESFFEHYGADVFHCPTCDGYEAKDREVVAFGWSADVAGFALTLLGWAKSVTVVTDGRHFEGDEGHFRQLCDNGVAVLEDEAVELLGERGRLEGVRLRRGSVVPCQVAFFSISHEPCTELAEELGCALTDEGCVEVDHEAATSVPGVYAAGDLTPGIQLVQVAAAKGTIAGVACAKSLRGEGGVPEAWAGRVPG